MLDQRHANDEELIKPVAGASVIYFTGGDPLHLLTTIRESKLLNSLRVELDKGAVLGGSSAGAMVMGSLMWNRLANEWVQGLGIAEGVAVLPHHETGDPATITKWLAETGAPQELKVLG